MIKNGHLTGFTSYNGLGQVITHEDPSAAGPTEFTFEASPSGRETTNRFAGWPRDIKTDYRINTTTVAGVSSGRLFRTVVRDENGNLSEVYTDYFGRKRSEWRHFEGGTTKTDYYYDDGGNVNRIVQPDGYGGRTEFSFTYDGRNRITGKTVPDQTSYTYQYYPNSDRLRYEYQPINDIEYVYTDYHEIEEVYFNSNKVKDITYGSSGIETGKVTSETVYFLDQVGNVAKTYTYDEYGRVATEDVVNSLGITDDYIYHYDMADNITLTERDHQNNAISPSKSLYLRDSTEFDDHARPERTLISFGANDPFYPVKKNTYSNKDWIMQKRFLNHSGGVLDDIDFGYNTRGWITNIGKAAGVFDWPKCSPDTNDIATICNPSIQLLDTICEDTIISIDIRLIYDGPMIEQCLEEYGEILFKVNYKFLEKTTLNSRGFKYTMSSNQSLSNLNYKEETVRLDVNKKAGDINFQQLAGRYKDSVLVRLDPHVPDLEQCLDFFDEIENAFNKVETYVTEDCTYEEKESTFSDSLLGYSGDLGVFGIYLFYDAADADLGAEAYYNGNISHMRWYTAGWGELAYGFCYDQLDRLIAANFTNTEWDDNLNKWVNAIDHKYSVPTIEYDDRGNITKLIRAGVQYRCEHVVETLSGVLPHYGIIDDLRYDYHLLSNKVKEIFEFASDAGGSGFGYNYSGNDYGYDDASNIISDARDATIYYNALSLPNQVGANRFTQILH